MSVPFCEQAMPLMPPSILPQFVIVKTEDRANAEISERRRGGSFDLSDSFISWVGGAKLLVWKMLEMSQITVIMMSLRLQCSYTACR